MTQETPRTERLLVFAKYPEAGRVKTRLIPALGAAGAASLHRDLTRRTFETAAAFAQSRGSQVDVWLDGGDDESRRQLVAPLPFGLFAQQGSDLGERLRHATATTFQAGATSVLVIGTDSPEITPDTLARAAQALQHCDVVLGPAHDGGYYLIGLRRDRPEVFQNIDWGSEQVLRQTLERCRAARLTVKQLSPLGDVDHAEDLILCRRSGSEFEVLPPAVAGRISIIIPTLNEESQIAEALRPLCLREGLEVIVADGGSADKTVELATSLGARVISARRGRGRQLNAGAALASGELLLFLHADSRLPISFTEQIRATLGRGAIAGAFPLRIAHDRAGFRWIEWGANLRSRYLQMVYGDQGLFLRAADFFRLGGFPNLPLMEDYEFCRRLRKRGRILLADESVSTSARRWLKLGLWRVTLTNQMCVAAYRLGVSPTRLAQWYARRPAVECSLREQNRAKRESHSHSQRD